MMEVLSVAERPPRDQARGGDFQPNSLPGKAAAGIEQADHKHKEEETCHWKK